MLRRDREPEPLPLPTLILNELHSVLQLFLRPDRGSLKRNSRFAGWETNTRDEPAGSQKATKGTDNGSPQAPEVVPCALALE
jgi:hypothetical protein